MIDISLIAQDIIDGENTFKTSPDTYNRSNFGLLSRSHTRSTHASQLNDKNTSDTALQQLNANAQREANTINANTISERTKHDPIIVQGGYVTNYFDMASCKSIGELLKAERKSIGELLKAERKKYVNAANLTGGSTVTLKNHSKSLNMYPFTLNLLQ
jgi:hypothetical protein